MTAEDIMRTTTYLGTIALGLAFGAANAIAGNLDPHASPYAVTSPTTVAPAPTNEGRAAYVGGEQDGRFGGALDHRAQQLSHDCHPARVRIQGAWRDAQICD
jgi:hypothetical protein